MANPKQRVTSKRRTACPRHATTRSWGFERLEERTVLSAAGAAVMVYVIDLSDIRGWEPPQQLSKSPTNVAEGVQRTTMRLDNATIVLMRSNQGNRRGASSRDDAPEGESSGNDFLAAALKIRNSESQPTNSVRVPSVVTTPTTPLQPAFSRATPVSTGFDGNSTAPAVNSVPAASSLSVIHVATPPAATASQLILPIIAADSNGGGYSIYSWRSGAMQSDSAYVQDNGPAQTQDDLLQRTGDAAMTDDLADSQWSYEVGQPADQHGVDDTDAGDEAWLPLSRTKRLRRTVPLQLQSPTVQPAMQQMVRQFPTAEEWAFYWDEDPGAQLAEVLTAEAARQARVSAAPPNPEEEGGAVTLTIETTPDSWSASRFTTDSPQQTLDQVVVPLQDVVVQMEFSAERYQAFDVSTEPTPATDPSREVAVERVETGN